MKTTRLSRIAICYDSLFCIGGAEKVTMFLSEAFPETRLCVDFVNQDFFSYIRRPDHLITLGKPRTGQIPTLLQGLYNFRTKTRFLRNYDCVIYSGTTAPLAVHNQHSGLRVLYCHTIPRFAYDLREYYLDTLPRWQHPAFHLLVALVRRTYEAAFKKMDIIFANSENVRRRVQHYLGTESIVIHPPVDTERLSWRGQDDYYLSTARLEAYKRVDLIVQAFTSMPDKRLVVASGGSDLERLKMMAADAHNITFTDWQHEEAMRDLVGRCIATIYIPKDEDFGMSPVESMAAGKPVIGAAEGGITETVVNGSTGILVAPTIDEIQKAVRLMTPSTANSMRASCVNRALQFGYATFLAKLEAHLNERIPPKSQKSL